jgi:hypothetical protein
MVSDEHAHEKLMQAVYALATGSGQIQERLANAAIHLSYVMVSHISDDKLRRAFIGVVDDLTYEGRSIHATMKVTGDEDARAIARRIVDLYLAFDRLLRGNLFSERVTPAGIPQSDSRPQKGSGSGAAPDSVALWGRHRSLIQDCRLGSEVTDDRCQPDSPAVKRVVSL